VQIVVLSDSFLASARDYVGSGQDLEVEEAPIIRSNEKRNWATRAEKGAAIVSEKSAKVASATQEAVGKATASASKAISEAASPHAKEFVSNLSVKSKEALEAAASTGKEITSRTGEFMANEIPWREHHKSFGKDLVEKSGEAIESAKSALGDGLEATKRAFQAIRYEYDERSRYGTKVEKVSLDAGDDVFETLLKGEAIQMEVLAHPASRIRANMTLESL
jgi:hypothetical protein